MRCSRQRCSRPARTLGLCKTHATSEADRLFSLAIRRRDGACLNCGTTRNLQCAHVVSRRYHVTRWRMSNAVTLCMGCHKRFTEWPLEWEDWVDARLGRVRHDALKYAARNGDVPDLDDVLTDLRRTA